MTRGEVAGGSELEVYVYEQPRAHGVAPSRGELRYVRRPHVAVARVEVVVTLVAVVGDFVYRAPQTGRSQGQRKLPNPTDIDTELLTVLRHGMGGCCQAQSQVMSRATTTPTS